jgi:hypothetical protein
MSLAFVNEAGYQLAHTQAKCYHLPECLKTYKNQMASKEQTLGYS